MENTALTQSRLGRKKDCRMEALFQKVVKDGDYIAFRELFTDHYTKLCHYAMRIVCLHETAEEVVSDVFIKLWKNKSQIEVHTSFEAYIYRAVRNQALDYLKLKSYRNREKESLDNLSWNVIYTDQITPLEELVFDEFYTTIENCINRLPRQCQLIFRLSREEGLRYREIAEKLNISVKTVETQMGRALKVLRDKLPNTRLVA